MNESMEIRITAMILGEASDFERAELAAAIAADPELAAFAREMEALVGAMPEAVAAGPTPAAWQLAPARRDALLKALGLPKPPPTVSRPAGTKPRIVPAFWKIAVPLAALVMLALLILPAGYVQKAGMRHEEAPGPQFEGAAGGFVSEGAVADPGTRVNADILAALDMPALAAVAPEKARSDARILSRESVPAPAAKPSPAAEPAASAPVSSLAAASDSAETQIRAFTGGWGKGSGSGTGTRARLERSELNESARESIAMPASESIDMLVDADEAAKAKDGLISYGAPVPQEAKARASKVADEKSDRVIQWGDEMESLRPSKPLRLFENQTSMVSTFSLHVADVSFRLAEQALLERGELPDPSQVRPEEFTAAFDYGDPGPGGDEAVALTVEQARHPTLPATNLLRVSVRVTSEGRAGGQPLNLIVLLDKSGSMERPDRAGAARRAVEALASKLGPDDRVSLATFDRVFHLVADGLSGPEAEKRLMAELGTYGESGTNLEEALTRLAGSPVLRRRGASAGRIVLITDGVANLGQTLPDRLAGRAEALRKAGFPVDVVAVGSGGGGDAVLEALARKADGRYFLLADGQASAAEFGDRLAGAFRPAASNVKVQVRFNPSRVKEWSLLGFDEHLLRERDFRDDSVGAAELAAAEQGTAVYMVRIDPSGSGEVGQLSVRFRETASGEMIERTRVIPFDPSAPALADAAPGMRVAGCATLFAEKLRGGPPAEGVSSAELAAILRGLPPAWRGPARVGRLEKMLETHTRLQPEP